MSTDSTPKTHELAGSLLRLHSIPASRLAQAAELDRGNFSAWLRGVPQRLSPDKVFRVLYHLGFDGAALRDDLKMAWADAPPFDDLKAVARHLTMTYGFRPVLHGSQPAGSSKASWVMEVGRVTIDLVEKPDPDFRSTQRLHQALAGLVEMDVDQSLIASLPEDRPDQGDTRAIVSRLLDSLVGSGAEPQGAADEIHDAVNAELLDRLSRSNQDLEVLRTPGQAPSDSPGT